MTSSNPHQTSNETTMMKLSGAKKAGVVALTGSLIFGVLAFSGISPALSAEANVPLGTTDNYSVIAGSTVTNTGASTLNKSIALTPGSAVTGFPPGIVNGIIDISNNPAIQAQSDLTIAYNNAAGRSVTAAVPVDLSGATLVGGVYKSGLGNLSLNGELTLDGENDPNSVFIFQSDSTLITGSASRINLVNNAQACNVFWKVGSSATLGTDSSFTGTVMALTSITAQTGATIDGHLFARNGAVTLDNNVFIMPGCDTAIPTNTATATSTTPTNTATATSTTPTNTATATATVTKGTETNTATATSTTPTNTATATATVTKGTETNTATATVTKGTETNTATINTETSISSDKEHLVKTGITQTTFAFGAIGLTLLLVGLGFMLIGRKNHTRKH